MNKTIYGLRQRNSDAIKYVGQTKLSLKARLRLWRSNSRAGKMTPVFSWIRSIPAECLEIIGLEVTDDPDACEARWIATIPGLAGNLGKRKTFGRMHPEETKARISARLKTAWTLRRGCGG